VGIDSSCGVHGRGKTSLKASQQARSKVTPHKRAVCGGRTGDLHKFHPKGMGEVGRGYPSDRQQWQRRGANAKEYQFLGQCLPLLGGQQTFATGNGFMSYRTGGGLSGIKKALGPKDNLSG